MVTLLLYHPDIEVTSSDYFGWTPLHLAAQRVHLLTLGFLLGHFKIVGINVNDKTKPIYHQSIWFGEYTALHCGVLGGSAGPSVLRLLLSNPGTDPNVKDRQGDTPLMQLLEGHSLSLLIKRTSKLRVLLECDRVDLDVKNPQRRPEDSER